MLAAAKEKCKGSLCHYSLLDSKNTSGLAPLPFPLFALDLSDCKLQAGPRLCCSPYRPQFVPYGIQCKAAAATSKHAVPGTEPGRVTAAAPGGGAKPSRMGHWGQRPPPCPTHTDTDTGSSPGFPARQSSGTVGLLGGRTSASGLAGEQSSPAAGHCGAPSAHGPVCHRSVPWGTEHSHPRGVWWWWHPGDTLV